MSEIVRVWDKELELWFILRLYSNNYYLQLSNKEPLIPWTSL